jgi:hypothetical protein
VVVGKRLWPTHRPRTRTARPEDCDESARFSRDHGGPSLRRSGRGNRNRRRLGQGRSSRAHCWGTGAQRIGNPCLDDHASMATGGNDLIRPVGGTDNTAPYHLRARCSRRVFPAASSRRMSQPHGPAISTGVPPRASNAENHSRRRGSLNNLASTLVCATARPLRHSPSDGQRDGLGVSTPSACQPRQRLRIPPDFASRPGPGRGAAPFPHRSEKGSGR